MHIRDLAQPGVARAHVVDRELCATGTQRLGRAVELHVAFDERLLGDLHDQAL